MTAGHVHTRADLEQRLLTKATRDTDFRQRLVSDPRRAIKDELGLDVPASILARADEVIE